MIIAEDEPLQRATVQAIRAAASVNDYKLILQLGAAVPLYYRRHHAASRRKMDPRILGEAVEALSRTTVRVGRITQLWRQWTTTTATATTTDVPPVTTVVTPREVNALLQALIDKGRLRGALQFYHNETTCAESTSTTTDAYSLSILLNALTASIGDDDDAKPAHPPPLPQLRNEELEPFCSPVCWQWNEAVRLLDTALLTMKATATATAGSGFDQQQQVLVNNPVVTALLQLNKRAAQVFRRHSGPERALWMLDFLQEHRIVPDTVTSALLLSSLGTEWELALALLRAASQQQQPVRSVVHASAQRVHGLGRHGRLCAQSTVQHHAAAAAGTARPRKRRR